MPLNKVLQKLVVQGKQRLDDAVKQYFGTDEDVSAQFDPNTGANGAYVVTDEQNGTTQVRLDIGNDLTDELEAGGAMELVIGNLLNFDPTEVIVDTRANQPAAGTADRVMFVTDDQVIEHDDGAAWNELGVSAAAITQGGASAINVEDFVTASVTDGQAPVAQGDGTLAMEGVSGPAIGEDEQYLAALGG